MEPGAIFFVVTAELKVKFDFNLHLLNFLLFEWQCSLLYDKYSYTGCQTPTHSTLPHNETNIFISYL